MAKLKLYLKVMRIDHWFKNIFVLLGSLAAVYYFKIEVNPFLSLYLIAGLMIACLVSSANYIMNEVLDAPFDRHHPVKRHRPIPSGQVKPHQLILLFCFIISLSVIASLMISWQFLIAVLTLFGAGLIYNLRPIRAKDIPYLDVISESVNNPIRIFIGWFAIYEGKQHPPLVLLALLWCFGAFLMTGKRLAELRFLGNNSARYRRVFRYYSNPTLIWVMVLYAIASLLLYFQLAFEFKRELFYTFPLVIIFILWFFKLSFEEESIVKEPERIYKRPLFFLFSAISFLLIIYFSFI